MLQRQLLLILAVLCRLIRLTLALRLQVQLSLESQGTSDRLTPQEVARQGQADRQAALLLRRKLKRHVSKP